MNPKGGSSFYILLLWTDFAPQGSDLTWGGPLESLFGLAAKVNIRRTYIYASVCVHLNGNARFPMKVECEKSPKISLTPEVPHWIELYISQEEALGDEEDLPTKQRNKQSAQRKDWRITENLQ